MLTIIETSDQLFCLHFIVVDLLVWSHTSSIQVGMREKIGKMLDRIVYETIIAKHAHTLALSFSSSSLVLFDKVFYGNILCDKQLHRWMNCVAFKSIALRLDFFVVFKHALTHWPKYTRTLVCTHLVNKQPNTHEKQCKI